MISIESLKLFLYWGGIVVFLLLELKFSYRSPSVSKFRRWLANLPLSIVNGVVYHACYFSVLMGVLVLSADKDLGLLNAFSLPMWLKTVLGILILDFFIYIWHLLNHVVPFFWRFHRVHHSDMNMDVSTANRFHIGELLLSGLLRLAVVYTFGIPLTAYFLFEILVNLSIQFHHSSIRINPAFEKVWMLLFVPPSMHRIHHSVKIRERDSNYGVLFSIWDRFLGTLTSRVDQDKMVIGIGSHRNFDRLNFWHLMLMPFTRKTL
jgi:sterol desaturase/sphingolipid hydroxylase (fatty acid hydroxylase superfamily)